MDQKDLKDMTASELLRKAAMGCYGNSKTVMGNLLYLMGRNCFAMHGDCFVELADKIDAELAKARELSLLQGAAIWAKANGWPDFRDGEDFGAWLDRCAIRIPCFEDGEPVHIGDKAEHPYTGETCTIYCINTFDDFYCLGFVEENSASLCDGERVKRPAPEVLGADGLPVKMGETVYRLSDGTSWTVIELHRSELRISVMSIDGNEVTSGGWFLASEYSHTHPDTQERIDGDAVNPSFAKYWGCSGIGCDECPASVDGKLPDERYGTSGCREAMVLDLLRRQRELDARKGGAE